MKHTLFLISLLFTFCCGLKAQFLDSTVTNLSVLRYDNANFVVGKDSIARTAYRFDENGTNVYRYKDVLINKKSSFKDSLFANIAKNVTGIIKSTGSNLIAANAADLRTAIGIATDATDGILSSADRLLFNSKQSQLASGTNIKSINTQSILGSGNLNITGGLDRQIQFNSAGIFGGSGLAKIDNNGSINISLDAGSLTPSSDYISLFNSKKANFSNLTTKNENGLPSEMQSSLANSSIGIWEAIPGQASFASGQGISIASTGTPAVRTQTNLNYVTRQKRAGLASAATVGALAELRGAGAYLNSGSGTINDGNGFFYKIIFVPSNAAAVSGERFFCGLSASLSASTNLEPNTLTNSIGIAQLSTDASQYYLVFAGTSNQTTAIGAAVGVPNGLSADVYELNIHSPQTPANTYYIELKNLRTGVSFTSTKTASTSTIGVQNGTYLTHKIWKTNNATAAAVAFDIVKIYYRLFNY